MKTSSLALVTALVGLSAGCYRADITTGLAPSGQVVEDEWVLGFVGGLAMVDDVDASECTNGIARVMTRQSFMNLLVNALTAGIVSPMEVRVECAARPGTPAPAVGAAPFPEAAQRLIAAAARRSAETGDVVYVRLDEPSAEQDAAVGSPAQPSLAR